MSWTEGTFSRLSAATAKKYVLLRLPVGGAPTKEAAQKVGFYAIPGVAVVNSEGKLLAGLTHNLPPLDVYNAIEGTPDHLAGLQALEKTKGNPQATVAALKKVAALPCKKAVEVLSEYAQDEAKPELVRKTAIELFGKQKEAGKEVVPFLTSKNMAYRNAASSALKAMGILALPPLLEGLESADAAERSACYMVAQAITKDPKVSREAPLWKSGKEADRQKALAAWRDWYEKNKPQVPKQQ